MRIKATEANTGQDLGRWIMNLGAGFAFNAGYYTMLGLPEELHWVAGKGGRGVLVDQSGLELARADAEGEVTLSEVQVALMGW